MTTWYLAQTIHPVFAAVAVISAFFFFFLTGLRQVHNAYHNALGLGRWLTDLTMFGLSIDMMSAMHAIQATHLNHHRHCREVDDVEGHGGQYTWRRALLGGPAFAVRLPRGRTLASVRTRRWIVAELVALALIATAAVLVDWTPLRAHVWTMIVGQCFAAFFAVWTVHHDCKPIGRIARTQRGWLKNLVSCDMFHHVQHHLFPAVPPVTFPSLRAVSIASHPTTRTSRFTEAKWTT